MLRIDLFDIPNIPGIQFHSINRLIYEMTRQRRGKMDLLFEGVPNMILNWQAMHM